VWGLAFVVALAVLNLLRGIIFNKMKHYGLIGYPLAHSFSKKYFTEKFEKENIEDSAYELYPLEDINGLQDLLDLNPDICGLNVTIPHKISIIKHLDWIEPDAKAAGAVNCVRVSSESPVMAAFSGELGVNGHDFRLEGFNTDIYGFEMSLTPLLKDYHDQALILGDGGAAKAVKCVLQNLGINFQIVTRRPLGNNLLFKDLQPHHIKNHKLIINTTPLGTSPNVNECPPIPYEAITEDHLLYDLVYNPEKNLIFRKRRRTRGGH